MTTTTVDFTFEDVIRTVNGLANKSAINDPVVVRASAALCMVSLINTANHISKLEKAVKESDGQHTTAETGRTYTSIEGDVIAIPVHPNNFVREVVGAVLKQAYGDVTPQILQANVNLFLNVYENITANFAKAYENKKEKENEETVPAEATEDLNT